MHLMWLKIVYGKEIHMRNTQDIMTYTELQNCIKQIFKKLPSKYNFIYIDEDGGRISLDKDSDMEALLQSGKEKVKIQILESNNESFYDQTQEIYIAREPAKIEEPEKSNIIEIQENNVKQIPISEIQVQKSEDKNESKIEESNSKIQQQKHEQKPIIHSCTKCQQCSKFPLIGIRYKCTICQNYDLCQQCEIKSTHDHPFLKIKKIKHTPLKIFTLLSDQEKSININGKTIPVPTISDGLSLLCGMFATNKSPQQCKQVFAKCKNQLKELRSNFKGIMNQINSKRQQKIQQKQENKLQIPSTQIMKMQPQPIPSLSQKYCIEQKKRLTQLQQNKMSVIANDICELLNLNFETAYNFATKYPGHTKEEIIEKYSNQL